MSMIGSSTLLDSETEDEEVKLNCAVGCRRSDDSICDSSLHGKYDATLESSRSVMSDNSEGSNQDERNILHFVSNYTAGLHLMRPTPERHGENTMHESHSELVTAPYPTDSLFTGNFEFVDDSNSTHVQLATVASDKPISADLVLPKRSLSENILTPLGNDSVVLFDSPKRMKRVSDAVERSSEPTMLKTISDLKSMASLKSCHRCSPVISSSDDDELDRQLREELISATAARDEVEYDSASYGDMRVPADVHEYDPTSLPLLTPPVSPLTITLEGGDVVTMCEWPSNLAVDCALVAAAANVQPLVMELSIIRDFEESDDEDEYTSQRCSLKTPPPRRTNNELNLAFQSTMTPLIQGLLVSTGNSAI
jgi:hypothetical protein